MHKRDSHKPPHNSIRLKLLRKCADLYRLILNEFIVYQGQFGRKIIERTQKCVRNQFNG